MLGGGKEAGPTVAGRKPLQSALPEQGSVPANITPGKSGNRYPDDFIRQVRTLWASGAFKSDPDMAEYLGMPAGSKRKQYAGAANRIGEWRAASAPDGIPWQEFRDRLAEKKLEAAEQALLEDFGEMSQRYLTWLRQVFAVGLQVPLAEREETEVRGPDGVRQTILSPKARPKNFRDLTAGAETLLKMERLIRGAATERVESGQRVVDLFIEAMIQAGFTEEERARVARKLDEMAETDFGREPGGLPRPAEA